MRITKLVTVPFRNAYSRLYPEKYARKIGVNILGRIRIYGKCSFSTEPWIITLGDNVHITDNVRFVTHDGGTLLFRDLEPSLEITKPIVVGDNVYIGVNSIILPGVTIGSNVIIGAGSVVSKDIPSNSLAVGVPARVIKTSDEYFEKLKKNSIGLGHLKGSDKQKALKEYYHYEGKK